MVPGTDPATSGRVHELVQNLPMAASGTVVCMLAEGSHATVRDLTRQRGTVYGTIICRLAERGASHMDVTGRVPVFLRAGRRLLRHM